MNAIQKRFLNGFKNRWFRCVLAATLLLGGCFGGSLPPENYIRLNAPLAKERQEGQALNNGDKVLVAIKQLTCMSGLDRLAVLVAKGPVLQPSNVWYWEDAPGNLLSQWLVDILGNSERVKPVWPYGSRVEHDMVLDGRVVLFEIQEDPSSTFRMKLNLGLWSKNSREMISNKTFESSAAIDSMNPHGIARAAEQTALQVEAEVIDWLEKSIPKKNE